MCLIARACVREQAKKRTDQPGLPSLQTRTTCTCATATAQTRSTPSRRKESSRTTRGEDTRQRRDLMHHTAPSPLTTVSVCFESVVQFESMAHLGWCRERSKPQPTTCWRVSTVQSARFSQRIGYSDSLMQFKWLYGAVLSENSSADDHLNADAYGYADVGVRCVT